MCLPYLKFSDLSPETSLFFIWPYGCERDMKGFKYLLPMATIYNLGLSARKPVFGFANNKGADQSAHGRRLISAFIIAFWKVSYLNLLQAKFHFSS